MRSFLNALAIIALALIGGFVGATLSPTQNQTKQETVLERVLRTNTLRCGYYVFPPFTKRDPKTGALSGISPDMMDYIAKKTGLKIEWAEEVTFGNWVPALQTRRFDAVCTPMWPDMPLGREALFIRPMIYSTIIPVVRNDDNRFTSRSLDQFNNPDITLSVQEGNATYFLAQEIFPKAKLLIVPPNADGNDSAQNVMTKKADALLWDSNGFVNFNKTNPGSLKPVETEIPVKIMPFSLVVHRGEADLKAFLDNAVDDMLMTGFVDRLLDKWEGEKGTFQRLTLPYRP